MNIVAGSIAIMLAFANDAYLPLSAIFIGIAAVFDFSDGMAARSLKAYSPMGKELDSLADMVSFGLAPAVIMYHLITMTVLGTNVDFCFCRVKSPDYFILGVPLLIVVFSGLRLAKFNVDTRQTDSFIGLATPANAILIASLPLILKFHTGPEQLISRSVILNTYFLLPLTVVMSLLLVAEFPMFSLKVKHLRFRGNEIRYLFLAFAIVLAIVFKIAAIFLIIVLYIVLSGINNLITKPKHNNPPPEKASS